VVGERSLPPLSSAPRLGARTPIGESREYQQERPRFHPLVLVVDENPVCPVCRTADEIFEPDV